MSLLNRLFPKQKPIQQPPLPTNELLNQVETNLHKLFRILQMQIASALDVETRRDLTKSEMERLHEIIANLVTAKHFIKKTLGEDYVE